MKRTNYMSNLHTLSHWKRLTSSWPTHVLESHIEVKLIIGRACYQIETNHLILSDVVVIWLKPNLNSCNEELAFIMYKSV